MCILPLEQRIINSFLWRQKMETINKQYIVDEHNKKIAVQIPIRTFEKIEEVLENYALFQLIKENEGGEILELREAKAYYNQLEKE